jgi:hypothetical protein
MLKKSNELDGVLKLKRLLFWEGLSYAVTGRVLTPPVTSPSPRCQGLPPVMAFIAPPLPGQPTAGGRPGRRAGVAPRSKEFPSSKGVVVL